MVKARTKLISLRMTEEEYEAVRQASANGGARCVSEFARNALLDSAARPKSSVSPENSVCAVLSGFDHRLARLESELAQVSVRLRIHLQDSAE
jgi:hypothetical protein